MGTERRVRDSRKKKIILTKEQSFDPDYFAWPKLFWMVVILFCTWLLIMSTFSPTRIPTFLGPVAVFGKFMGSKYPNLCVFICAFGLVIHITQAAFAGKVCHDRGMTTSATIKWVFSTLLFGFPSLVLQLLPHKPDFKTS